MSVLLAACLVVIGARGALAWLNLRHQARVGHQVPAELAGALSVAELLRIRAYAQARDRFGLLQSALLAALGMGLLFGGGLGAYDAAVASLQLSFVASGVVFFSGLVLAGAIIELPFAWYSDFRIEAAHGFNKKTPQLFWADWFKGTLLSLILGAPLCAGALWLVSATGGYWWLWVSLLILAFGLVMTLAAPRLIEPLFYRMRPLAEQGLRQAVQNLTERAGVEVGRVLTVDASRRSAHSNAYFTGLGRVKRVVLFDTLLEQMTPPQILAILAHELGHWKKRHVLWRMLVGQAVITLGAYLACRLAPLPLVPELVGLTEASFAARIVILYVVGSLLLFVFTPVFSFWSRADERAADRFAVELHGEAQDLADALCKLGRANLSSLHPHPWFAAFYYSHPPLPERIGALRRLANP